MNQIKEIAFDVSFWSSKLDSQWEADDEPSSKDKYGCQLRSSWERMKRNAEMYE